MAMVNSCHRCGKYGKAAPDAPALCAACGLALALEMGERLAEQPQPKPSDLDLFDHLRMESRPVFIQKNQAYGAAYNRRGLLGVLVRAEDKIQRAFQLLLNGADEGDERLKDTLMDLENYATIARICEDRGNLRGE